MKQHVAHLLEEFETLSLSEMDSVSLMKRTDTKFVIHEKHLLEVLKEIKNQYRILEINQNKLLPYNSLYFDTPSKKF